VRFEYEPTLVRAIKKVPGRIFDPVARAWLVPVEEGSLENLLATLGEVDCSVELAPEAKS
ncbi:MAG: hypothetical protein ACE5JE_09335, partial [Thermoplasmata archaeon]